LIGGIQGVLSWILVPATTTPMVVGTFVVLQKR
jgi:hypothetical protein